ncbi:MAG: hypothetical protein L6243_01310 [Candidatus Altiarchaeales archaeon]|nr:hypothetical protein [Candidatus Altiarchaeota archaeon]MCG2782208.1 hypothetical protein [Candidatus Altiarchaeales archaeon]MBU4267031.1 hypothetical protein [Candidatus Altiarchaeota archaeon]MBU4341529.1 hypothetical protein [Candidatus Altiarchaeota archaeon]MBU4406163.1 hypothetical protein [Candidatus Altiarchaeota archaeon]
MVVTTVGLIVSVLLLFAGIVLVVSAFGPAIRSRKSDSALVSFLMVFAGLFAILMALGIISLIIFRQGAMVEIRDSVGILADAIGIESATLVLVAYFVILLPFLYKAGYKHDKMKDIREEEGGVGFFSNLKIALMSDNINQLRSYFILSVFVLFILIVSMLYELLEFMLLALVLQVIIILIVVFYVLENYKALEAATVDKSMEGFLDRLGIDYNEKEIIGGVNFYFENFESRQKAGADKEELSRIYHEVAKEISWHVRKQKKIF